MEIAEAGGIGNTLPALVASGARRGFVLAHSIDGHGRVCDGDEFFGFLRVRHHRQSPGD